MNKKTEVKLLIDFGMQPISNRYLKNSAEEEKLFSLKLGQCQRTGIIQLINPVSFKELVPRYDWITYYEPENHLDSLVTKISNSFLKNRRPKIGGISVKDESALKRFQELGCQTWRIDPITDLQFSKNAGTESVQAALNTKKSEEILSKYGRSDLLIVRHLWEHVYNQNDFAEALKKLVFEKGYILFEVPDCSNLIDSLDYTMPWEEHLYYYTPFTFIQSLKSHGFEIVDFEIIPYLYENSLVALVRKNELKQEKNILDKHELEKSLRKGDDYSKNFIPQRSEVIKIIKKEDRKRKIMLFGAGHCSGAFINHYSLKEFIECVVDDNKKKQNLFMPKSGLPIVHSINFSKNKPTLCLLAVNPLHEEKIISLHKNLIEAGGDFRSICPMSKYSVYK